MSKIWLYAFSSKVLYSLSDDIMAAKSNSSSKCGREVSTRNARVVVCKLLRLVIALLLITACGSVSAIVCKRFRDSRIELDDGEFEAFVAAHSNEVCFLGVNMYSQGSVYHSIYRKRQRAAGLLVSDITLIVGGECSSECPVRLSRPISGRNEMILGSARNDAIVRLKLVESVQHKFWIGLEKHWVEKTVEEITTLTGIQMGGVEVQTNDCISTWSISSCGTNAALRVLVESRPSRVCFGSSNRLWESRSEDYRDQTSRCIIVTPLVKRKPKRVLKTSEMTNPEIEVDI